MLLVTHAGVSSLSPGTFAALLLQFCHFRKGPSAQASAPVPFTFSGFSVLFVLLSLCPVPWNNMRNMMNVMGFILRFK